MIKTNTYKTGRETMKESTKDQKAMYFYEVTLRAYKGDSFIHIEDMTTKIAGNEYYCHLIMEDQTCYVYQSVDGLNSIEIGQIKF